MSLACFVDGYEERDVIVAQGIEFHDSDKRARAVKIKRWADTLENDPTPEQVEQVSQELEKQFGRGLAPFQRTPAVLKGIARGLRKSIETPLQEYLEQHVDGYTRLSDDEGEYVCDAQLVYFKVKAVRTKSEFKAALETEGIQVIYEGHSRYGRGACFDQYSGEFTPQGEQWEDGTTNDNGLFRLGYPVLPVELKDIEHHGYQFRPVAAADGLPEMAYRHPDIRRQVGKITLPDDLTGQVAPYYESDNNQYYGLKLGGLDNIVVYADWVSTVNDPFDLGALDFKCRVFCHFGCSSRLHYWEVIRRDAYKGWKRDDPPTDRFAYFTTNFSVGDTAAMWLTNWMKFPKENANESWWKSLQEAKRRTNIQLNANRLGYEIY